MKALQYQLRAINSSIFNLWQRIAFVATTILLITPPLEATQPDPQKIERHGKIVVEFHHPYFNGRVWDTPPHSEQRLVRVIAVDDDWLYYEYCSPPTGCNPLVKGRPFFRRSHIEQTTSALRVSWWLEMPQRVLDKDPNIWDEIIKSLIGSPSFPNQILARSHEASQDPIVLVDWPYQFDRFRDQLKEVLQVVPESPDPVDKHYVFKRLAEKAQRWLEFIEAP